MCVASRYMRHEGQEKSKSDTNPQIIWQPHKLACQKNCPFSNSRHLIWSCALLKRIAHAHLCSNRFSTFWISTSPSIDGIHNWRLCNYSFVFVLIILNSLVSTDKIQSYLSFKVRMINIKKKGIISWTPFMNTVYTNQCNVLVRERIFLRPRETKLVWEGKILEPRGCGLCINRRATRHKSK